jgi:hypothetical protein
MKDSFKFQKEFDTGEVINEPLGRIRLGSGAVVRLFFTPDGLKMLVPKASMENGDVVLYDDGSGQTLASLGSLLERYDPAV